MIDEIIGDNFIILPIKQFFCNSTFDQIQKLNELYEFPDIILFGKLNDYDGIFIKYGDNDITPFKEFVYSKTGRQYYIMYGKNENEIITQLSTIMK